MEEIASALRAIVAALDWIATAILISAFMRACFNA